MVAIRFRSAHRSALLVGALLLAACQTAPTWPLPEGLRVIRVDGYPMAYLEAGRGPTVVLVHGVWSDYRALGAVQRALADRFRVISVSLRHAWPEPWDGTGSGYSPGRHSRDLVSFIERIGGPVHLVGQSYGDQVALAAARTRPDLVARLVLAEGGPVQDPDVPSDVQAAQFAALGARTEQLLRTRGLDAGLEFAVDALAASGVWARYPEAVKAVHRQNAWTLVGLARDPAPAALRCEEFGALPMPVMLLTGENTSPRHKALVRRQAACLPSARVATIPGVAHLVQLNAPAVRAALEEFLK